jgi:hypothetical protein
MVGSGLDRSANRRTESRGSGKDRSLPMFISYIFPISAVICLLMILNYRGQLQK